MNLRLSIVVGLLVLGSVLGAVAAAPEQENRPVPPGDRPADYNAVRKLGRGCANFFFGVVEVPNQVTKARSEHGGAAVPYGLIKGVGRWFGRELVGLYEIVTFPIPVHHGYQPVMHPEWPNEDFEP